MLHLLGPVGSSTNKSETCRSEWLCICPEAYSGHPSSSSSSVPNSSSCCRSNKLWDAVLAMKAALACTCHQAVHGSYTADANYHQLSAKTYKISISMRKQCKLNASSHSQLHWQGN